MNSIEPIINYLKDIQDNLVGILIPTIITSIMSIVTLITNSVIQLIINDRQYKCKQYDIMREHYPELKARLIEIVNDYIIIEENGLYEQEFLITDYLGFNWEEYRKKLSNVKIQHVDAFEQKVKEIISIFIDLNGFFATKNLPTSSKKVQRAINNFQVFCAFVNASRNKLYSSPTNIYNRKKVEKLINILDKHYNKF